MGVQYLEDQRDCIVLTLVRNGQVDLLAEVRKDFAERSERLVKRRCLILLGIIGCRAVFVQFCDTALEEGAEHSGSNWIFYICDEANMQKAADCLLKTFQL